MSAGVGTALRRGGMAASFEVNAKIERVRAVLRAEGLAGARLRGVDWFAWATGGADSSVIFSTETGIAEAFISLDRAVVLTNTIEIGRLAEEMITEDYEMFAAAWIDGAGADRFVSECLGTNARVASDRPRTAVSGTAGEIAISERILELKLTLGRDGPTELERYRALGRDAAEAMTEAMTRARPGMTEVELAGCGAEALWARGIHPLLTLVSGERRGLVYRHPVASYEKLGSRAMLVFCGRRHGLFANLTRFVSFRPETDVERARFDGITRVEAAAFRATMEERSLDRVYARIASAYAEVGAAAEIGLHHQGGSCGYLSREAVATPSLTDPVYAGRERAYAWNPSMPGAKIEDTVFLDSSGKLEILTVDPKWPTVEVDGRRRPAVWVRE